jgi:HlyD family secretion protein
MNKNNVIVKYSMLWAVMMLTLWSACGEKRQGIHPKVSTLTEAIYSAVTVVPQSSYTVFPSVSGIIEVCELEEGMLVSQGEVLLKIKRDQADLEQRKAVLQYEQARKNYAGDKAVLYEMTERINSARSKLIVDSSTFARQARLWQQNIGSRQTYEQAMLVFETSRNQLRELTSAYDRTQGELGTQLALAATAVKQRQSTYEDYLIRAEFSGTVYEIFKEQGESVTPQTPLARIGSTHDFTLQLSIDETDIARVEKGQEVIVSLDAYPMKTFMAEVTKITPRKDELTQTYAAEAIFLKAPPKLFDGLSGEANIVVSRREGIMTLPTAFVGQGNVVVTAEGSRTVVTGITDFKNVEIISGIDTSTIVYQAE